MSVDRIALRLQSEELSVAEISAIVGRSATRATERGSPVSSRRKDGPTHSVATATFEWAGAWDDLSAFVDAQIEVFERIAGERAKSGEFSVDVVAAVTSRPLGYIVELGPSQVATLSAAGCGIVLDVFSPDDAELESDG